MRISTLKPRQIKCTCPRGRYSVNCRIARHRELAWDINTLFHSSKLTWRERILHSVSSKVFARGLYLVLAGLFLIVAGNTVRQIVVSEPSIPAIVQQEAEHKTTTAPARDPNLLPTLDEAFNTPIVTEGQIRHDD